MTLAAGILTILVAIFLVYAAVSGGATWNQKPNGYWGTFVLVCAAALIFSALHSIA